MLRYHIAICAATVAHVPVTGSTTHPPGSMHATVGDRPRVAFTKLSPVALP